MASQIDTSVQTHTSSYSPPRVPSKIQKLEKIYFVAGQPISSVCFVFTDEKTRNAAYEAFKGYQYFHPSIPNSEQLEDDHCLTIGLERLIFGDKGFLSSIQRLLTSLGKQLENSEQATDVPILLVFEDSDL